MVLEKEQYQILNGDSLGIMKTWPNNSIDSIVTDPPYGLSSYTPKELNDILKCWINGETYNHTKKGFMGEEWDVFVPDPIFWKECLRVLKPGGHILAMGGTRTNHLLATSLELAGFEKRDTVYYAYGSGFPKSHNISKGIDKKNGGMKNDNRLGIYLNIQRRKMNITTTKLNNLFLKNQLNRELKQGERSDMWTHYKNGTIIPNEKDMKTLNDLEMYDGRFDEYIKLLTKNLNKKISEKLYNNKGTVKFFKEDYILGDITQSTSPQAQKWDGWGTAMKPAVEPIILVRKPFKGTVANNILKWGTGGLNIDECRVEGEKLKPQKTGKTSKAFNLTEKERKAGTGKLGDNDISNEKEKGRFPANLILDGSEEVKSFFPNTKKGGAIRKDYQINNTVYGDMSKMTSNHTEGYGDSGNASRFFYCAKPSKKEKNEGLENILNTNPCVKPISLMSYLITLITPLNGIVYDPFNGSGSTGKAVVRLNKEKPERNFKYIGSEIDKNYCEISKARIKYEVEKVIGTTKTYDEIIDERQITLDDIIKGERNE